MSAAGSFGSASPPFCCPAQGTRREEGCPNIRPTLIPQTNPDFEFPSSAPIPWCASSGTYRKGEPWKFLLSASSGQRNCSIYVSAAKG